MQLLDELQTCERELSRLIAEGQRRKEEVSDLISVRGHLRISIDLIPRRSKLKDLEQCAKDESL